MEAVRIEDHYEKLPVLSTGTRAVDDVLDGGLLPGTMTLLTGIAGVGKSRLALQVAAAMSSAEMIDAATGKPMSQPLKVIYVTPDESAARFWERAARIGGVGELFDVIISDDVRDVLRVITPRNPELVIVNSLERMVDVSLGRRAAAQLERCVEHFSTFAHVHDAIVVGVLTTQDKSPAVMIGGNRLTAMADCIVEMGLTDDPTLRSLRSYKNRYGNIDVLGLLRIMAHGFESVDASAT